MRTEKKLIRTYLKALKNLPGSREKNGEYLSYIRASIEEVCAGRPEDREAAILELLGEPEAARESYIRNLSPEELELGRREKRKRRGIRLVVLLPVCLLLLAFGLFFLQKYYFEPSTVCIARPVDKNVRQYIEFPTLVHPETAFGISARTAYRDKLFSDNTRMVYDELRSKYSEGCHIICQVHAQRGKTLVIWTGTGVTAEGLIEDVGRQYSFPYAFQVKEQEELTGEAAERAKASEEALLQALAKYERAEAAKNAVIAVSFFYGDRNATGKDGWFNLDEITSITVFWSSSLTPESLRLFYTPSGTETAEETRLLGVRVPGDGDTEVTFAVSELDMPSGTLLGHLQAELDYGAAKAVSEVYKVFCEEITK